MEFLKDKDIRAAVNTHFHEDHVGANKMIMEQFGIYIFAHPESVKRIAEKIDLLPYQVTVWGQPEPSAVKKIPEEIRTERFIFKVVETPGHSIGHIALVELTKGWCFSGDIFAREKPKFIRPEEDVGLMIKSMERLIDLPCDRLILFTSVGKIIGDGRKAMSECISYLKDMADKAKKLNGNGARIEEIMKAMFGGEHNFAGITNSHYSTYNFVNSLLNVK
jgi:glyoxylase-like metal-dependent hydrolase (beta-lactamase superfamily II)